MNFEIELRVAIVSNGVFKDEEEAQVNGKSIDFLHSVLCLLECGSQSRAGRRVSVSAIATRIVHNVPGEMLGRLVMKRESGWKDRKQSRLYIMTASYHELTLEKDKELEGRRRDGVVWLWEKITD
jgi:hypothetical protein